MVRVNEQGISLSGGELEYEYEYEYEYGDLYDGASGR